MALLAGLQSEEDAVLASSARTASSAAGGRASEPLLRPPSVIAALFEGALASTVVCGSCKHVSTTTEPVTWVS